jgi:hypothetical protein
MKLINLSFFLIISLRLFSQIDSGSEIAKNQSYMNFAAGTAIPLGDFADPKIGGASPARGFLFNWTIPVNGPNLGVYFQISHNIFNANDSAFIYQQNDKAVLNGFEGDFETFVTGNEKSFAITNFIAGIFISYRIDNLAITTKIGGGANSTYRSGSKVSSSNEAMNNFYQVDESVFHQDASVSRSFVFDLGLGLRYSILKSDRVFITFDTDLLSTNGNFIYNSYSQHQSNGIIVVGDHDETSIHGLNTIAFNLGIGIKLGKNIGE